MIRFVIADDLTGAADASVPFAGTRTVEIHLPALRPVLGWGRSAAGLTVLDTESRSMAADQAAFLVAAACEGLDGGVFKKVDSTLRGPVAAELKAARLALGRNSVVLAPSLPVQGRTVKAGRLLVDGIDAGDAADLLGVAAFSVAAEALAGPLPELAVVDAVTDADLDRIAGACDRRPDLLPAGSAGLAAAFARLEGSSAAHELPGCRRVLVAVASRHPTTRAQLAVLLAEPRPEIEILAVPDDAVGTPAELVAGLGREVVGHITRPLPAFGGTPPLRGGEIPIAVLASGGDAALAVCLELGFTSIRPRAEVLSGVVWSETGRKGLGLATKAGGFGGPRLLLDAALKLLGVASDG